MRETFLYDKETVEEMDEIKNTKKSYGFLWKRARDRRPVDVWHFNSMQEVIPEPIVRGKVGIDIGSGCGYDTYIMAKNNPSAKIYSMDISDGIYTTKGLVCGLMNVSMIKGSVLGIPIKDNVFDFAYSFGVLHHVPDSGRGLREITRILKIGAPVFLYLYEDHSENRIKYYALRIITVLRRFTTRIPAEILYIVSYLASPFAVILFSCLSRTLSKFVLTRPLSEKMPFNFGTHPFSLAGDLYDRFSAPVEHRFSRKEAFDLLDKNKFTDIKVERLRTKAGWVVWGYKD